MSITFYYSPQSNASRIHGSLIELGIPFEKVRLDLRAGEQKKPEFLALNPNGKVPTLVIDGTPMFESVAIQIALGERYGVEKGLWPAPSSPEHLTALSWIVWGQVTLGATLQRYLVNTSDHVPAALHHAGQAEVAMNDLRHQLGILDGHLATRAYIAGASYSLADCDLAAVINWGRWAAKLDLAPYAHLSAWVERVNDRPALKATMAAER